MKSPAESLEGITLETGWVVQRLLPKDPDATGGNFSVGYIAERIKDKAPGFVKVLDIPRALGDRNPADVLKAVLDAFIFERDLLIKCRDSNMDRIVTPLEHGGVEVNWGGQLITMHYLIFPLAECDCRKRLGQSRAAEAFELAWRMRSLHNVAVGLRQLHSKEIAHQDLKPSNVLVFAKEGSKVGDLGRSTDRLVPAKHDSAPWAGDTTYAPLDQLYGRTPEEHKKRYGCDLYLLGSLIMFFFSGVSTTAEVLSRLPKEQHWTEWGDGFEAILPTLRHAWSDAIRSFETKASNRAGDLAPTIVEMVRQLTDPDPQLRGHPDNRTGGDQYSLERYVSGLNLLALKAEHRRK